MLKSFWGSFFNSDSETEKTDLDLTYSEKSTAQSTYRSQGEMLKVLGREDEDGLCNPLTNLFAKNQITGDPKTDILSKSNKEAYVAAVLEENHQDELRNKGADGKHSAFVDTHTPFKVQTIPAEEAVKLKVDTVLPTSGQVIITFPVEDERGSDAYHQVYLRKNEKECLSFDAEREGGSKRGDCRELFNDFVKSMSTKQDNNRPRKEVTIASTLFFSDRAQQSNGASNNLTQHTASYR